MAVIGGESIGTAYVRIISDGSGLPESVREEMRKAEPEMRSAGGKASKKYHEGWQTESERQGKTTVRKLAESINFGSGLMEARGRGLASEMWDGITKGLNRRLQDESLAKQVTDDLQRDFSRGSTWDDINQALSENFVEIVQRAETQVTARTRKEAAERIRITERESREREAEFAALYRRMDQAAEASDRAMAGLEADRASRRRRQNRLDLADFDTLFHKLENEPPKSATGLRRLIDEIDNLGDASGRTFGRGSRNNFINFFGGLVGGSVKLLGIVPRAIKGITDLGQGLGTVTSALRSGQGLGAALEQAGTGMGAIAGTAAGAVAAIAALVIILPILVSSLVLLGGILVAVGGSVSFALIGGLTALGGLVLPVAAGIGVLVGAIASLDDKTKKALKESIKPLTTEMKSLGRVAAKELFADAPEQAGRLGGVLKGLRPLVKGIATEIRETGNAWLDALEGPGFKRFKKEMTDFLPDAVGDLGTILGNTLGGIGGLLTGAIPITERLLGFLERITEEFADWANTAAGQQQIIDFLDKAGDSAGSLAELIDNVGELLGELFTAGQATGDTIIDKMAAKVQEFVDFLNAHPDTVANFFSDVGDFADSVGNAILAVGKFIDVLDSPESRKNAMRMFDLINDSITVTAGIFGVLEDVVNGVFGAIKTAASEFGGVMVGAFAILTDALLKTAETINKALPKKFEIDTSDLEKTSEDLHELADQLNGDDFDPLDIKVNDQELKDLQEQTGLSAKEMQKLFGLPEFKPKVDDNQVVRGRKAIQDLIHEDDTLISQKEANLRVKKTEVDAAKLATLRAIEKWGDLKGLTSGSLSLKIRNQEAKVARDIVNQLNTALGILPGVKTIHINTIYSVYRTGTQASASGGEIDALGMKVKPRRHALGGMLNWQQEWRANNIGGEAGREIVVPLDRPLGQIDESARLLAAVARGLVPVGGGTTVNNQLTVITPTEDPIAAAYEAVTQLAIVGGY